MIKIIFLCMTMTIPSLFMNKTLIADDISNSIYLEIAHKKINLSRWGEIGKNIKLIKIGMYKNDVLDLLGKPNKYPIDNASIWQYLPSGNFSGGKNGPDWNFVILFNAQDKVKSYEFRKWVYGPPPQ